MKSLVAMRELNKKVVDASKAISRYDHIKECLDNTVALAESAKIAYEKARLEIVEADSQVAILTKKLEHALNTQKIASKALEVANGENRRLRDEALGKQDEFLKLKSELEECQNGKTAVETTRTH
ncbi:hypothetical protein Adt_21495 [Abeliophyllum distichum]|uniref:Uncharacterized protein n=1 Tax=Abeliophyllum distichum TaxID=126358 RepID=A0ABD1SZK2_9LAMI